ncbi:hypothetical protein ACFL4Y_04480, partial [Gemmatimonadota bacterium]
MELPRALRTTLLLPSGADPSPTKDDQVWRLGLLVLAGGAALGVVARIAGESTGAILLFALVSLWVWVTAVRLLFEDTRLRIVWLFVLGGSAVALLVSGPNVAGFIIAVVLTLLFLLFRTYRPYRYL